jgi:hypothetical protein
MNVMFGTSIPKEYELSIALHCTALHRIASHRIASHHIATDD